MKYPLFSLLLFLGLLLAGCQAPILDPAQPLPFPPVWQEGDHSARYLMAATYHATWLVNQVGADETAYRVQFAAWGCLSPNPNMSGCDTLIWTMTDSKRCY